MFLVSSEFRQDYEVGLFFTLPIMVTAWLCLVLTFVFNRRAPGLGAGARPAPRNTSAHLTVLGRSLALGAAVLFLNRPHYCDS